MGDANSRYGGGVRQSMPEPPATDECLHRLGEPPANPRDLLVRRAAQLRDEAAALETLATALPGRMDFRAEDALRRLLQVELKVSIG